MKRLGQFVVALAWVTVGCSPTPSSGRCVPGMAIDCVCSAGVHGVQVCQGDGTFTACDCAGTDAGGSTDGAVADTGSGADGGAGDANVVDAFVAPDAFDPCAGHLTYGGRVDGAGPVWGALPGAAGMTGLDAGNAACAAIGADHACDYTEVVAAAAAHEAMFMAIPMGTTAWLQRTTTVDVMGTPSPAGPGGNCNNWNYATNHTADGEYITFDAAGTPTYHFDNDTIYDPTSPGVHTSTDLQCGGVTRAILCCNAACM